MRIAVVGAGGTGGLFGGLLAKAGNEVTFLARGATLSAIASKGLEVQSAQFGTFRVDVRASDQPAELGQSDLVLCTVKTYDLASALPATSQLLAPTGHVLTVQNGLDAPDQAAAVVGPEHVMIGTTVVETTILEPGVIGHFSPSHLFRIAAFDGPPDAAVKTVVDTFKAAGINATVAEDGHRALWEKAGSLIPLATLTSVCQLPIGPIRELPETRRLGQTLIDELVEVGRACGYDLSDLSKSAMAQLDRIPPTMKASMARDFERGGRTELDALTGAIVRLADQQGVDVPATRACLAILKLREAQKTMGAAASTQ